jgi:phosphatidylinositol glycan class N
LFLQALGYTHRETFSVLYILAALWPFFYGITFVEKNKVLLGTWALLCVMMSAFTLLPALKVEDVTLM